MDTKTIQRILDLVEPQLSTQDFQTIRTIIRKEWLMDAIDIRVAFLAQKKQDAVIRAQYLHELPKLQAQLASL